MSLLPLLPYCVAIPLASLAGGWLIIRAKLTHRRMEHLLSFVSGFMLGVAMLHLLPHAIIEYAAAAGHEHDGHHHAGPIAHEVLDPVLWWALAGFLTMFFVERFFCFHHHDAPSGEGAAHECAHGGHGHELRWAGAAIGLTVHSVIAGVALAASVAAARDGEARWAGFGTFLVIVLHKPFDALTVASLMRAGGRSAFAQHLANVLFSLAVPLGVVLFAIGTARAGGGGATTVTGAALAFSTGTFLCIALSDLLPELQFHRHDRIKLSIALLAGVLLALLVGHAE